MSVTIRALGVRESARAILIDLDGERHWMPKSQIEAIDGDTAFEGDPYDGEHHAFTVSDWIAQQKGFVLNEERYVADDHRHGVPGVDLYAIKEGSDVIGYAPSKKKASVIAAALNLTIGKV